jgi:thymidylate kinase
MTNHVARLLTFSGIDGAGKSTQIESVCGFLVQRGFRVSRVAFWNDVAVMPNLRARASFQALRRKQVDRESAVLRCDKNIRTWYLTVIWAVFYLLDGLSLRRAVAKLQARGADFIVFDRYIYDQLVQIRARHWLALGYMRLLIAIAPIPDFGFVLDASPDEAFLRKPEYPLSFMHEYRRAFLELRSLVPELIVIPPAPIEQVRQQVLQHMSKAGNDRHSLEAAEEFILSGSP